MKNDERSPQASYRGGLIRFAGAMTVLGLVLAVGGCEKIRAVVEKAAKNSD